MSDERTRSFNAREVAELCGVDLETVQEWVEDGELKVFELPGRAEHRVFAADLVAYLRDNDQPVPAELEGARRPARPKARR
jgi:excisionase family DNA binding protein